MNRHFPNYSEALVPYARKLRRNMTDAERKLWSLVRGRQLGVKIRRQVPIGRYIVDFLCQEKKLIIELDGGQHYTPDGLKRDKARDEFLRGLGYTVLRISNIDMMKHADSVLEEVHSHLQMAASPSTIR